MYITSDFQNSELFGSAPSVQELYMDAAGRREQIVHILSKIDQRLSTLPQEDFLCHRNGNGYKWYRVRDADVTAAAGVHKPEDSPVDSMEISHGRGNTVSAGTARGRGNTVSAGNVRERGNTVSAGAVHVQDDIVSEVAADGRKEGPGKRERYQYLPKTELSLARKLAFSKYLRLLKEDLDNEQRAIDLFMRRIDRGSRRAEQFYAAPGVSDLLAPSMEEDQAEILKWEHEDYCKNRERPEGLIVPTIGGFNVRSKSEALIANVLTERGIPFRYECLQIIGDRKMAPDFTILHPQTRQIVIWEHFGLMSTTAYQAEYLAKMERYILSGFVPYVNLITTYETKVNPFDVRNANRIVKMMFGR